MDAKRVTIKKMAEQLHLSPSTVSRALQNHSSIGETTSREVQQLASKLGYVPNSMASSLRRRKTNLIGVMIPRIDRHFHSLAISGIEEVANKAGYYIAIFQSNDSYKKEVENARMLLSHNADGVIACLALNTLKFDHFRQFRRNNIPLVFYDRVCDEFETGKVLIDDHDAAFKACSHLAEMGCSRIAHIAGNQNSTIFKKRFEGYLEGLTTNGLTYDESLVRFGDELNIAEGEKFAGELFNLPLPPDGLVCANDITAIGAIQTAKRMGIKVPSELAVTGFSNTPFSTIIEPALTSVDDHAFEMGQAAARLLIRQVENKDSHIVSESIIIRNDLVVRGSSKKG